MKRNLASLINAKTARQIQVLADEGMSPAEISEVVETTDNVLVSEEAVAKFLGKKSKAKAKAKKDDETKKEGPGKTDE